MFDITQFRYDIVVPTLNAIQIRSDCIVELLVFTCAVESAGGTYLKQMNGTALGIYQLEPASYTDLWVNYIMRKPDIINLLSLNLNINRMPDPLDLITDLKLATICTVLFYKHRKANLITQDEDTLWTVYKEFYNTEKGKAAKDASIKAYRKFIRA